VPVRAIIFLLFKVFFESLL